MSSHSRRYDVKHATEQSKRAFILVPQYDLKCGVETGPNKALASALKPDLNQLEPQTDTKSPIYVLWHVPSPVADPPDKMACLQRSSLDTVFSGNVAEHFR